MIPTILLGIFSAALAWLQFFKKSHLTWKVAGWIFLVIAVTSFWSAWDRYISDQELATALGRNATRVFWNESLLSAHLLGNSGSALQDGVAVHIKVFPPTIARSNPLVQWAGMDLECIWGREGHLGMLTAERSEFLYRFFEDQHGSIYTAKERKYGIESLYYESASNYNLNPEFIGTSLDLEMFSGINVGSSNFTTLHDLNGSVLVAYVRSHVNEPPISLNWIVKSSAGHSHLSFEFPGRKQDSRWISSRFSGICVPEDYFRGASEI